MEGIILFLLYPAPFNHEDIGPKRIKAAIFCMFLFTVFSFWDTDWFHYQDIFVKLNLNPDFASHMEDLYVFLMRDVCPHYFIFRILVWGPAVFFILLIIERLKINPSLCWFFFAAYSLPLFSYARVSLAMVIMYYGACIINNPYKNREKLSYILGFLLILGSHFFHKSAVLGIVPVLFSLIVKPVNKNSWFYLLLAFLAVSVAARFVLTSVLSADLSDSSFANYADNMEGDSRNIYIGVATMPLIRKLMTHIPYFLTAFLSFRIQNEYDVPKQIEGILKIQLYLVIFSCVFAMNLGADTATIYGRLLRFTIVPAAFVLSYAFQYGLFPRLTRFTIVFSMTSLAYLLFYSLYLTVVK